MLKKSIALVAILFISLSSFAQLLQKKEVFTKADTLRGALSPLRTCYDINYYHLDVKFDIANKFISGSNLFKFTATQDFKKLQFDLFANLKIERVVYKGKDLQFTREYNAVFITFPQTIAKGSKDEFTVFYSGNPQVAKHAPWDGGVVYTADSLGNAWVATACQGLGASVWWPNKDHQSDEVDSMLISISAPSNLKDVSNGRLRKVTKLKDGYTRYDWFVSNPINNYDVEANIGNYVHFSDTYNGLKGKLTLDYWVLSYNIDKAKKQFGANVKPMLNAFEHWFGPYPFYKDGYKLIETPHLGMEHQSGVAYGNKYHNGYLGRDLSGTGRGLDWDFIVVHESGHEWFGNNITSKDVADMWIHESFTNYSESLFIESRSGKLAGQEYVHGTRMAIQNDGPIIGPYDVNKEGSGDMYYKGGNMLNMIRTIINNDEKWRSILTGLNKTFYHQTVTTGQVVDYINQQSGMNLTKIFDQYLRFRNIPTLEFRFVGGKAYARWISDVDGFDMPVRVRVKGGEYQFIKPVNTFKPIQVEGLTKDNLEVDTFDYYIGVLVD
ncbi:M1 family metallopeptidase [Mucilaginibacter sp. KACC 22063]|uniref:M1 family metallopeptidase n=1 Tax=Mucilaginibacter sp. KACC 22063 TaxID=3025666 RepID=UPI00236524A4|nr:M1 family metallopeptidase [Mucilaginibacter sp. KACC 22063]WDF56563.1 M1 family metallopeptidase [Mucilaginibacter sp. KACC 22063]